ncbi:MAG: DUF2958 domain-containing protein [Armatimonadetes bacterium]|nr:DUF2958 domain-containing protein [Armatimonadota bacterium]
MLKVAANTPKLYGTQGTPAEDKLITTKFFALGSAATWLVAEYDPEDRLVFCYADIYGAGREGGAEWGYTSLEELESLKFGIIPRVEKDTNFRPRKFSECVNAEGRITA